MYLGIFLSWDLFVLDFMRRSDSKSTLKQQEVFYKIVKGGADKSYGIQVAKLAGVPDPVINRAKEIVEELVTADITGKVKDIAVQGSETKKKTQKKLDEVDLTQFSLFDTVKDDDVLNELKELDISHMTPMDAMNKLYQLQNKLRNRW